MKVDSSLKNLLIIIGDKIIKKIKHEVIKIKEFTMPWVLTSKLLIVANFFIIVKFKPNKNIGRKPLIRDIKIIFAI